MAASAGEKSAGVNRNGNGNGVMAKMWRHQSINNQAAAAYVKMAGVSAGIRDRRRNGGENITRWQWRRQPAGVAWRRGVASIINGGRRMAVNLALAAKPLASGGESEEETRQ
jgi:hypothetical protein